MTTLTREFHVNLPIDDALVACARATARMGWTIESIDAYRIVSSVGGGRSDLFKVDVALSHSGQETTSVLVTGTTPSAGSHQQGELTSEMNRLHRAIETSVQEQPDRSSVTRTLGTIRRWAMVVFRSPVGLAFACVATLTCALFLVFPSWLGMWVQLVFFLALVPFGVAIHLWSDRKSGDARRSLGPLVLFTFVYVVVLSSRALSLAVGDEGRYFEVEGPSGFTSTKYSTLLTKDRPEVNDAEPATVVSDTGLTPGGDSGLRTSVAPAATNAFAGSAVVRFSFSGEAGAYVAAEFRGPREKSLRVVPREPVSASIAVLPVAGRAEGGVMRLYVRYRDARGEFVRDDLVSGSATRTQIRSLAPATWKWLHGRSRAPSRAATASLLYLITQWNPGVSYELLLDAPAIVPGDLSTAQFASYADPRAGVRSPWRSSFVSALAIAIATLAAVFLGYLLSLGDRMAAWVPALELRDLRTRSTRRLVFGLTALGVVAYLVEIATYGGYAGYLDSLHEVWRAAAGKWYLHALATIPTGIAVYLVAWRATQGRRSEWGWAERALIALGLLIGVSYLLKSTIAIPLATALLLLYFLHRRAAAALWAAGGVFALLTPFIYSVRGAGTISIGELFSHAYWEEFFGNLSSRFFHFESLMFAAPYPASEHFWRPAVDAAVAAVPRVAWDDKPLSASARFTEHFLLPGLARPTDVGVMSFPGELWVLGGAAGVILGGLLIGILLRVTHVVIVDRRGERGTLLFACGILTALLLLNDGEGFVSVGILFAIASLGWLLLLQRKKRLG